MDPNFEDLFATESIGERNQQSRGKNEMFEVRLTGIQHLNVTKG